MTDGVEDFPIATKKTRGRLSEKQLVDYRHQRERLLEWLQVFGKDPEKAEGYSEYTVRDTMYRTDQFYRWVWDREDGYTMNVTTDHADEYLKDLAKRDCTAANKATIFRAVQRLFKWHEHEHNAGGWDPLIQFTTSQTGLPRDFLTRDERTEIREAALEYGEIPGYNDLTPDERDRWKIHISQKFGKPKNDVVPADWDRLNGWKIPSLVWTSLDCGLRPVEVKRAKASWIDLMNERLIIPASESSKNRNNWKPPLTSRTVTALERWIEERALYDEYEDTDALWLTQKNNPYSSGSLGYLLKNLFDIAEIPKANRQVSWYMIRHSTGTFVAREEGLEAARQVLRHNSPESTMRYDQVPEDDLRDALDNIG